MSTTACGPSDRLPQDHDRARSGPLRLLVVLAVVLGVPGCRSETKQIDFEVRFEAPADHRVPTTGELALPFEAAWDRLLAEAGRRDLRILSAQKPQRFAVFEWAQQATPEDLDHGIARYVDCGRARRTFREDGEATTLEAARAGPTRYRALHAETADTYTVHDVERRVSLQARTTAYLRPARERGTRIALNTRYTLALEASGSARVVPKRGTSEAESVRALLPVRHEIRFTSSKPGRIEGPTGLTCVATGALEAELIALLSPDGDV